MIVHPDARRQGIGAALMTRALDHLDAAGVSCVKLDATPAGLPLYRRLGFEEEVLFARWMGVATATRSPHHALVAARATRPGPPARPRQRSVPTDRTCSPCSKPTRWPRMWFASPSRTSKGMRWRERAHRNLSRADRQHGPRARGPAARCAAESLLRPAGLHRCEHGRPTRSGPSRGGWSRADAAADAHAPRRDGGSRYGRDALRERGTGVRLRRCTGNSRCERQQIDAEAAERGERTRSTALRVVLLRPQHYSSPSTTPKEEGLWVRIQPASREALARSSRRTSACSA